MCPQTADDDVWGDDSDGPDGPQDLSREWEVRREGFYNTGYREGLEEGKEQTLQQGFNAGFTAGAHAAYSWGALRGAAKTLEVFAGQVAGTSELQPKVEALAKLVDVDPKAAMVQICVGTSEAAVASGRGDDVPSLRHRAEGVPEVDLKGISTEAVRQLQELGFSLPTPPGLPET